MTEKPQNEDVWRSIFETGNPQLQGLRKHYDWWPAWPSYARCRLCLLPFSGIGGVWMRRVHNWRPSERNRHYCNKCDDFINKYPGGAEVTISVLFVDVRNSVGLAEKIGPTEYGRIINEFTVTASETLTDADGFIVKFSGDAVAAVYPPGFLRANYAQRAIAGAEQLLRTKMPSTPYGELAIGIGVYTGIAYIGTLHSQKLASNRTGYDPAYFEVQPLGDVPNVSARLSGEASPSEALISESTLAAAGYKPGELEPHDRDLKGRHAPVTTYALTRDTSPLGE
jgi:adenylate cyclase